jgi:site-specific recombinase XerD
MFWFSAESFQGNRSSMRLRLVRTGVDLVTIQHLLGHSKITTTTRYAHSFADAKMATVRGLDFAGVR